MGSSALKSIVAAGAASAAVLAGSLPAAALDRRVTIVNNTGYTMVRFYASHRDAKSWQENIFGNKVLANGYSVSINIDDGTGYCIFDFKAVFDDGDEVESWGNNVCELSTFTFNP
ncbi:hypothetical protein [Maritimibacter sp. UBA3975]|uniref:hypothetical protein n=1 Tax=Maritimibacter sp. UBA3975 TaxID=1946833 RepID=UPI000C0B2A7C|nr:hypothetical protein [Maritimibacter sp. UBA3975]MAM62756.1 hypothetical protein [Maritimibacter sp.]|tara:strand:- start:14389 stop:14733 length:345 start_codon:yes stop_codon:yes gene_type:complete